jgi:tetratricopeptide (TPR) repeat protein
MEGRALYTPQRLFGEVGSSSDILSHEPFLERARLQREQEHDGSARLALGAYVVARLIDKLLAMETDSVALDSFRWQLEAVRRHVDELPVDAPETAHLAGVVAAVPAPGRPTPSLWMSLTAYAYFLEHEGRLEESLEILTQAARVQGTGTPAPDFTAYALFAGRLNRQLARWDVATTCYGAAEEAASKTGDQVSALRGRLGKGAVHRGQGNYPLARSIAEDVVRDATALELPDAQALAYADLGTIYNFQGLRMEALKAHYQAFRLTRDSLQRMRTLSDLAIDLSEIGAYDAARLAFEIVINSNTSNLVRVNALLELMDLESLAGNRVAFERCRNAVGHTNAAGQTFDSLSPGIATDFQFKLGIGLARFGQLGRAREALQAALALAEANRLNAWYFKIEQALEQLSLSQDNELEKQKALAMSEVPVIDQVMVGLREYAALAEA